MVNLHCGHKVNERELVDRLKDEFEIQLSTSNLEEMIFKGKEAIYDKRGIKDHSVRSVKGV